MKFAALGSGSQGNGLVVSSAGTTVLVDCGFSLTETLRRLARLDLSPTDLQAVLVTHEHEDHVGGVARLALKHKIPVWMTPGTLRGLEGLFDGCDLRLVRGYARFQVGDLNIQPYPVPHDAREPSQFVFETGTRRLGLLTDVGAFTPHIVDTLTGCDALLLECNHDSSLLARSRYPDALKRRISGNWGHLSNKAASDLLAELKSDQLRRVVAMHLSQENNHPDLVHSAIAQHLDLTSCQLDVAHQDAGTPWLSI